MRSHCDLNRWLLAAWLVAGVSRASLGGGGPENVLLVVNPESRASLAIGNHYQQLRQVPAANVLYLPWDPGRETTDVDTFRDRILGPVMKVVRSRSPVCRIDYVVYSSDFPWGINLQGDVKKYLDGKLPGALPPRMGSSAEPSSDGKSSDKKPTDKKPSDNGSAEKPSKDAAAKWPRMLTKRGSINGLTCLWQPVLLGNAAAYMSLDTNWYVRRPGPEQQQPSLGFSSSDRFTEDGERADKGGRTYLLSTMLGVTAGRGNTVDEVLAYLGRSAAADGTHPSGTIYYVKNSNIRSRTREGGFEEARRQLESLGVAAEIPEGILPRDKDDVQGAMLGTANFDWKASGSTILAGAICEHLTSSGGVMRSGAGQTPLSELLRYGAAGAAGTVIEPFALQAKFPLPSIHVHYARGCTLAEAFYQSVAAPYQLLIVGDPLCRPWASVPAVRVEGVEPGASVKGMLTLKPQASVGDGAEVDRFELFVDGARRDRSAPGEPLEIDTASLADGDHDLRVVAFAGGPIRTQGRWIAAVTTANHGRTIEMSVAPSARVTLGKPISVDVKSPGAIGIAVMQNTRMLGRINGEQGHIEIDSGDLGAGPVRLHAVALGGSGPISDVVAAGVEVTVEPEE